MDKILEIHGKAIYHFFSLFIIDYSIFLEADSDIVVQSGARWEDINDTLKEKGIPLFFPVIASRKNLIAMLIIISA
jgi:hypothetical protein